VDLDVPSSRTPRLPIQQQIDSASSQVGGTLNRPAFRAEERVTSHDLPQVLVSGQMSYVIHAMRGRGDIRQYLARGLTTQLSSMTTVPPGSPKPCPPTTCTWPLWMAKSICPSMSPCVGTTSQMPATRSFGNVDRPPLKSCAIWTRSKI
jgi:hypothetical protein